MCNSQSNALTASITRRVCEGGGVADVVLEPVLSCWPVTRPHDRAVSRSAMVSCVNCGKAGADKKCAKCYAVAYCSKDCQRENWKAHKKQCAQLAKQKQQQDDEDSGVSNSAVLSFQTG